MTEMIMIGIASALGILILLAKMDLWKLLGFDILLDILATCTLMIMYAGTLGGMVAAMVGGLFISIALLVLKKLFGYLKPHITWNSYKPSVEWETVPGLLFNSGMQTRGYYNNVVYNVEPA
jgi:hypothetical protein